MKNFIKLFVVVLALAFVFISCEKGGTIDVTNQMSGDPLTHSNLVIIVKGEKITDAVNDLASGKGTPMTQGQTKTFSYSEDGIYTVVALFPSGFFKPVTLLMGSNEKVTIK